MFAEEEIGSQDGVAFLEKKDILQNNTGILKKTKTKMFGAVTV